MIKFSVCLEAKQRCVVGTEVMDGVHLNVRTTIQVITSATSVSGKFVTEGESPTPCDPSDTEGEWQCSRRVTGQQAISKRMKF